jgi:hypothetical protein
MKKKKTGSNGSSAVVSLSPPKASSRSTSKYTSVRSSRGRRKDYKKRISANDSSLRTIVAAIIIANKTPAKEESRSVAVRLLMNMDRNRYHVP